MTAEACLTCDKFATDASFLPELRQQKDKTLHLIGQRQEASAPAPASR